MDKREISRLVKEAVSLGRKTLTEPEAKEILRLSSVPVPRFFVVKDVGGAIEAAAKLNCPLVLKIVSPDILHKSDVGGVAPGIKDAKEIEDQWSMMILNVAFEAPQAIIEGFLIEEEVQKGIEVIVSAVKDEQFGVVAMFGLGGVAVELLKDVSFALGPLDRNSALSMMSEVKGFPLLTGWRGDTFKDINSIADVIVSITKIVEETDGLKEIEINPLMVYDKGVVAVDARAVLG